MDQDPSSDSAKVMASLFAVRMESTSKLSGVTFERKLEVVAAALVASGWQVTAALSLRPSWSMWLERPMHCLLARRIARQLSDGIESADSEDRLLDKLTRVASLVEFGAAVSEQWYWHLRGLVHDGASTPARLRKLMRCTTVWWDRDGELHVDQHHWLTQLLIWMLIGLSAFGTFYLLARSGYLASLHGFTRNLVVPVYCAGCWALVGTWAWWVGPHSWRAVPVLRGLLEFSDARKPS